MIVWTWLWIVWLGAFLLIEGLALWRKGSRGTLSWHLWWWLGLRQGANPPRFVWIRRMFLLCFTAWLVIHVFTGGYV